MKNVFSWLRKRWITRKLRRANRRLTYHYTMVQKYCSILSENVAINNQVCWDVILEKLPKSVEEITLTLGCGDYFSYTNARQWNTFLIRLDELDFHYCRSLFTNRQLPGEEEIISVIYFLTYLSAMNTSLLSKYQEANRYAFF